ncbi:MAG: ABC transporter permease subunit [Desulfurococcales archaeon]
MRQDKILSQSYGINPYRYSTYVFALTSMMQSICGSIATLYLLYINFDSVFNPYIFLLALVIGLLGGYLSILGPIISSITIIFLYEYTSRIAENLNLALIGAIVIAVTLYLRTNISEILIQLYRRS